MQRIGGIAGEIKGPDRDRLGDYHPVVVFAYFAVVIVLAVVMFHPVMCAVSLAGALCYATALRGRKALKFFVGLPLIMMVLIFLMNPVFVHKGVTVLFMVGDVQITKEAFVYGAVAALMTGSVTMWFYCYSVVMTQDKFMAVFGRRAPASSLIFSMVLRFIPRFTEQAAKVDEAQSGFFVTRGEECGTDFRISDEDVVKDSDKFENERGEDVGHAPEKKNRIRRAMSSMSILTTWAMENTVETADSMRARGYGLSGRTSCLSRRAVSRDIVMAVLLTVATACVMGAKINGALYFAAYPVVTGVNEGYMTVGTIIVYAALCLMPSAALASSFWTSRLLKFRN